MGRKLHDRLNRTPRVKLGSYTNVVEIFLSVKRTESHWPSYSCPLFPASSICGFLWRKIQLIDRMKRFWIALTAFLTSSGGLPWKKKRITLNYSLFKLIYFPPHVHRLFVFKTINQGQIQYYLCWLVGVVGCKVAVDLCALRCCFWACTSPFTLPHLSVLIIFARSLSLCDTLGCLMWVVQMLLRSDHSWFLGNK